MRLYELTKEGIKCALEARRQGTLAPGNLPIRVRRASLRDAMVYYWGRGVPVDPNHLKWDLTQAKAN